MAQEIQRTYDTALAAVIVQIQDEFGNITGHTIHVMNVTVCPGCGTRFVTDVNGNVDVDATVAQIISDIDASNANIKAKMIAAGWTTAP